MDLAAAVRELYALGPAEFVAGRDRLAKAARAGGDAELSAAVKKLRKPSAGAWLANMLALHRQADLLPVLQLGAELREAQDQLDGDELRRLGRERTGVIRSALDTARGLAEQLGQQVGEAAVADLEQTLRAALNDPEAAAAVASGQLVRGVSATGLGPVDLDGALADPPSVPPVPVLPNHRLRPVADPEPATRSGRPARGRPADGVPAQDDVPAQDGAGQDGAGGPDGASDARERKAREAAERRERERAEAQQQVAEARAAVEAVDGELAETRAAVTRKAAEYERLGAELSRLREQVTTLDRRAKDARRQHRDAEKTLRRLPS